MDYETLQAKVASYFRRTDLSDEIDLAILFAQSRISVDLEETT